MKITLEGNKKVNAHIDNHIICTDQKVENGGEGSAPEPLTLLWAALGTCSGIYAKSFCDKRNISSENLEINIELKRNAETNKIEGVDMQIQLPDNFPEKYKKALISSVNLCAVKRFMLEPPAFNTYIKISND